MTRLFLLTADAPDEVCEAYTMRQRIERVEELPNSMRHLKSPSLRNIVLEEVTPENKQRASNVLSNTGIPGDDLMHLTSKKEKVIWVMRHRRLKELMCLVESI